MNPSRLLFHLQWLHPQPISIPVENDILLQPLSTLAFFDPLTPPRARPQTSQEPNSAVLGVGPVMSAHYHFDGFRGFLGVIKWDDRDVMVEDVSFDDAMEQRTTYESEITVNGCCSSCSKSPGTGSIMCNGRVRVLQIRDCNFRIGSAIIIVRCSVTLWGGRSERT